MTPSPSRNTAKLHPLSRHLAPALVLLAAARALAAPGAPSNLPDTTEAPSAAGAAEADAGEASAAGGEAADGVPAGDASAEPAAGAPTSEAAVDAANHVAELADAMPTLHDEGLLTLGLGTGLAIVSTVAFVVGTDAEHGLLQGGNSQAELDALLTRRLIAASVAWPSLAASVLAIGGGVTLSALDILQERSATGPFTLDDPPFATRPRISAEPDAAGADDDADESDFAEDSAVDGGASTTGVSATDAASTDAAAEPAPSDGTAPRDDIDGDAATTTPSEESVP